MTNDLSSKQGMLARLRELPAWRADRDFTHQEWAAFIDVAKLVQTANPDVVASALDDLMRERFSEEYRGTETDSKPFILMRVVFELPEAAPVEQRFSYKGWSNWPVPDARNQVNLGWPVTWQGGHPGLQALYDGSMGRPYTASAEYRFLLQTFPFRKL